MKQTMHRVVIYRNNHSSIPATATATANANANANVTMTGESLGRKLMDQ